MIKKLSLLLLLTIAFSALFSCGEKNPYSHAELSLMLPDYFYGTEDKNFDAAFTDGSSVIAIIRISFNAAIAEGIIDTLTPTEFGKYWLKRCGRDAVIINDNGVIFATYHDGRGYFYLEAFYRSQYAYFTVLFAGDEENEEALYTEFLNYAGGVRLGK